MAASTPSGEYEAIAIIGDEVQAFVPAPLPPSPSPSLCEGISSPKVQRLYEQALLGLGRLAEVQALLPRPALMVEAFAQKEAVVSTQIEGTTARVKDMLLADAAGKPDAPDEDVRAVQGYIRALHDGLAAVAAGRNITPALLNDLHGVLMAGSADAHTGRFRTEPNWVDGRRPRDATFVPPHNRHVPRLMNELCAFLKRNGGPPVLLKSAMAHAQFETIHPYTDGNGRLGRLLIPMILRQEALEQVSLLFVSLYFKQHRSAYVRHLQRIRTHGEWDKWFEFFLRAIAEVAHTAVDTAHRLDALFRSDRARIESAGGRRQASLLRVHDALQTAAIGSIAGLMESTGLSRPTVTDGVQQLTELGIVEETTGARYSQLFAYRDFIRILDEGTEVGP